MTRCKKLDGWERTEVKELFYKMDSKPQTEMTDSNQIEVRCATPWCPFKQAT